jgi:hypothetical protein
MSGESKHEGQRLFPLINDQSQQPNGPVAEDGRRVRNRRDFTKRGLPRKARNVHVPHLEFGTGIL